MEMFWTDAIYKGSNDDIGGTLPSFMRLSDEEEMSLHSYGNTETQNVEQSEVGAESITNP